MDIIAKAKSVRISARKVRLVTDSIRKMPVDQVLNVLSVTKKRGASDLEKTLKSAISNAVNNSNLQRDNLKDIIRLPEEEFILIKKEVLT